MSALVVNLYGGPGTGKSTTAAATFAELKHSGVNCELVTEFAKDKVWENSLDVLGNQVYITGKQYHRLWRLQEQVDVIVTDSPLLLGLIYGSKESNAYKNLVFDLYNRFHNLDVYLVRRKPYNPKGRIQNEDQAKIIDRSLLEIIKEFDLTLDADTMAAEVITQRALKILQRSQQGGLVSDGELHTS